MLNVKFYLDKPDKNRLFPIHLVIRKKTVQIKVATGEKLRKKDWDNKNQLVKETEFRHKSINKFLSFIKSEIDKHLETAPISQLTDKKIKEKIYHLINRRKKYVSTEIAHEDSTYSIGKEHITFIDLFAGAGGFSEGFLQA